MPLCFQGQVEIVMNAIQIGSTLRIALADYLFEKCLFLKRGSVWTLFKYESTVDNRCVHENLINLIPN